MDKHVKEMRALAECLVKYSFPQVSPEDEEAISVLKQREIVVDGYDLIVYFNKCRYMDVWMETLQVFGKYFTFLPFWLVCKVAYKFLGDKELSLVELMHHKNNVLDEHSRRIYVWTVHFNSQGQPIVSPYIYQFEPRNCQGLRYSSVDQNQIKFF